MTDTPVPPEPRPHDASAARGGGSADPPPQAPARAAGAATGTGVGTAAGTATSPEVAIATGTGAAPAGGRHPVMETAGTLIERMGIEVTEAGPQRVVGTMPVAGNTQPYGLLHGGASAVLAESLGSVGAALHAGAGRLALGVDLNATHHRGVRPGPDGAAVVTGVATAVHLGRSTAAYEIVVTDGDGRRLCTARLTCHVVDAPPGS